MPPEPDRAVAAALTRRGPSSIDDLARDEDLERDAVKRGVMELIQAGRVDVAPDPETGAALYALREGHGSDTAMRLGSVHRDPE